MWRIVSNIFVLSTFLFVSAYNTIVWVHYEMNVEEITEAFCINKDRPELKCNGKCHLKKQLITDDTRDENNPSRIEYLPEIQLFVKTAGTTINPVIRIFKNNFPALTDSYHYISWYDIFHPPKG